MPCEVSKNQVVGSRIPIQDAARKATGEFLYTDDLFRPGMLYGKMLLSPHAHAKIRSIDVSEALKLPGVHAVLTHENTPDCVFNRHGEDINLHNNERIFNPVVRFVGDRVAAVAAESREVAERAVRAIRVEYELLPVYVDVQEALKPDAYPIHEGGNVLEQVLMTQGDVEAGLGEADLIFEDSYELPAIHHAAIEPHTTLAEYDRDGKLTVYTPSQDVFGVRLNLSRIFRLPMNKLRVINPGMGGGFGGKIDMILEPVAVALAMACRKPVKLTYTRREDIAATGCRHAMRLDIKTGVNRDGTIVAQDVKAYINAGGYASCTSSVCWAMGGKLFKAYKTPHLRYEAVPVYTNTQVSNAMRGFGSPQFAFAQQRQLNKIAAQLGIPLLDIQRKNLVEPDAADAFSGVPFGNPRPLDCVDEGARLFDWERGLAEQDASAQENGRYRIGVGMAVACHGNGVFGVMPDSTGVIIKMNEDGTATVYTGVSDMGNYTVTTQLQIVSDVLGIPMDHLACIQTDTESTMWDLGNFSSRGTFVGGHAAVKAAEKARETLAKYAGEMLESDPEGLSFSNGRVFPETAPDKSVSLAEIMDYAKKTYGQDVCVAETFPNNAAVFSYGAHFVKVRLDTQEGTVEVLEYTAVHDVGKAINPMGVEGQIEGAVHMGLGYALSEEMVHDATGKLLSTSFRNYKLLKAEDMPPIQIGLIEKLEQAGPYGAKSIGECSVAPTVGAIANAISNAAGVDFHKVPLKKETILAALQEDKK